MFGLMDMDAAFLQADKKPELAPQDFSQVKSDNWTVAETKASNKSHQAAWSAVYVLNATTDADGRNGRQAVVGKNGESFTPLIRTTY